MSTGKNTNEEKMVNLLEAEEEEVDSGHLFCNYT